MRILCCALALGFALGCQTTYGNPPGDDYVDCGVGTEPTLGEHGVLTFIHDFGSFGCMFGCSADEPLAERAQSRVVIVGEGTLPAIQAVSDNPDVFEVTELDGATIALETYGPGSARLEIRNDATDELIDALALEVKAVSTIEYGYPTYQQQLTIMVQGAERIGLNLLDERGCRVVGIGGVDYALQGGIGEDEVGLVDALMDFLFDGLFSSVDEYVDIDAIAVGSGSIGVSAPSGAALDIPLSVVDEGAVTHVEAVPSSEDGVFAVGTSNAINGAAWAAGEEPIYSPGGQWTIDPADGPISLDSNEGSSVYVTAETPGSATVTYSLGSQEDSVGIQFE